jgi:hypothetical protein
MLKHALGMNMRDHHEGAQSSLTPPKPVHDEMLPAMLAIRYGWRRLLSAFWLWTQRPNATTL